VIVKRRTHASAPTVDPFKKKSLVGLPSLSGFIDLDGNMVIATEVSQRQQF